MTAPRWMRLVLILAGVYNLVWGALVVLFPHAMFRFGGLERDGEPINYPEVWQCVGMIVGVYGIGYLLAARDPLRHWPIVLVGLLGKVFGPLGTLKAALQGTLPWTTTVTHLGNDFIWWIPFFLILRAAHQASLAEANTAPPGGFARVLADARDQQGRSLAELSRGVPLLVVFLRHFG
jgi:hypothetical protein